MISVSNLSYAFNERSVLRFPDFQVARGEQVLLLGQSGTGKTTLLHLLGGLRRNYHGSIHIEEIELSSLSSSALDHYRGEKVGFVFQRNHLIQALNVEDNLRIAPYLANLRIDQQRIDHVLDRLGLAAYRMKRIQQLSQGQAQRVALARAVLNSPAILIADEPTSALDDANCGRVLDLMLDVAAENKASLVIATHDRRLMNRLKTQIVLA